MFQKKKTKEKKPIQEPPKPQKIDELKETTEEEVKAEVVAEEVVEEEQHQETAGQQAGTEPIVEEELTEEQVRGWMKDVAIVVNEQEKRIARIEHHLRIDFD